MKVKDLIAQLSKLDPNMEIFCYEDGPVPTPANYVGPFDIVDVNAHPVVLSREPSGRVNVNFDSDAPHARPHAIIGITSDL